MRLLIDTLLAANIAAASAAVTLLTIHANTIGAF